ncbi:MAG: J domain-containing protein [Campylobacterales bacterium]|nr:J domain-containing protein [Campylobacterales bacterium]
MEVVLQNNLILIRTSFESLHAPWIEAFLSAQAHDILFLPRAMLLFYNDALEGDRRRFIDALSDHYATEHLFSAAFYRRSLMRYLRKPIKIEVTSCEELCSVGVELSAKSAQRVVASVARPNPWVVLFLRSQLEEFVLECSPTTLLLDMSQMHAKSRLERMLSKKHVLHFSIFFRYDTHFMRKLYGDFAEFGFEDEESHVADMTHYYTVLECPVGASQDLLKKSYKKLVKVYHPDLVHYEHPEVVNQYTRKFQLLQEAYTALRIVS